jgi:putative ABC transport system permease protein
MLSGLVAGPVVSFLGRPPVLGACLAGLGLALAVMTSGGSDANPVQAIVAAVAVATGCSVLIGWVGRGRVPALSSSAAGLAGRLARQNAARSPRRTSSTATALMIGIALVTMVGVVGQSLKAGFTDTLDRAVRADLVIYDTNTGLPFPGEVADRIDQVDGLAAVSRFRLNEIRIGSQVDEIAAYDADTGQRLLDFDLSTGSTEGLLTGGVLVHADTAEQQDLAVGDTVSVEFPDLAAEELVVAGVFRDDSVLDTPWIIDIGLYQRHVNAGDDLYIAAALAEGADPATVKARVETAIEEFPSVSVEDTAEFRQTQQGLIDQVIALINYLLAFALFVAFLGVINTIGLSVLERTREIGLLRAVGMTRRQVKATIRWESVMICLFGAALGLGLGALAAWALIVGALPDELSTSLAVPWRSLLFTVLVAAVAGMVAAALPARRAARLDVLDAITTTA